MRSFYSLTASGLYANGGSGSRVSTPFVNAASPAPSSRRNSIAAPSSRRNSYAASSSIGGANKTTPRRLSVVSPASEKEAEERKKEKRRLSSLLGATRDWKEENAGKKKTPTTSAATTTTKTAATVDADDAQTPAEVPGVAKAASGAANGGGKTWKKLAAWNQMSSSFFRGRNKLQG